MLNKGLPKEDQMSPVSEATTTIKAYSYLRFSTLGQAAGDSHRRQTELERFQ
jgi:hypothetical protein